jgi:uncharacterized membrane protein YqjE
MSDATYTVHEGRSLAGIIAEIKDELKEFAQTRVQLLQSEMKETTANIKAALPLAIVGVTLLVTAYLLLTLALVGLVAAAFWHSPYAWFFSFLIVGILWSLGGAMMAYFAVRQFKTRAMFPKKTVEVLKADGAWLQRESRSQV